MNYKSNITTNMIVHFNGILNKKADRINEEIPFY